MLPWKSIKTILLDLDGTLLDLYFDNYFWQDFIPRCYAKQTGMSEQAAYEDLMAKYQSVAGTLHWYCLDYWSHRLNLDIAKLKTEISHMIQIHPTVIAFLRCLSQTDKQILLVTNAHQHSLALKLEKTALEEYFDQIVCAHDFGLPKEDARFWGRMSKKHPFDTTQTLLIDDSLPVLRSASRFGIKYLLAAAKPDSRRAANKNDEFRSITDFSRIMPVNCA